MELSARDTANQLRDIARQIKERFDANAETIAFCDGEAIDLYHAFEFLDKQQAEELGLADQFRENRRRRRQAKDDNELWLPLYEMIMNPDLNIAGTFNSARRRVQDAVKNQANRRYTVKSRSDLQKVFDQLAAGRS